MARQDSWQSIASMMGALKQGSATTAGIAGNMMNAGLKMREQNLANRQANLSRLQKAISDIKQMKEAGRQREHETVLQDDQQTHDTSIANLNNSASKDTTLALERARQEGDEDMFGKKQEYFNELLNDPRVKGNQYIGVDGITTQRAPDNVTDWAQIEAMKVGFDADTAADTAYQKLSAANPVIHSYKIMMGLDPNTQHLPHAERDAMARESMVAYVQENGLDKGIDISRSSAAELWGHIQAHIKDKYRDDFASYMKNQYDLRGGNVRELEPEKLDKIIDDYWTMMIPEAKEITPTEQKPEPVRFSGSLENAIDTTKDPNEEWHRFVQSVQSFLNNLTTQSTDYDDDAESVRRRLNMMSRGQKKTFDWVGWLTGRESDQLWDDLKKLQRGKEIVTGTPEVDYNAIYKQPFNISNPGLK